jgi:branched-chain amino acid transport system permease protein
MNPVKFSRHLRPLALIALVAFVGIFPVGIAPNDAVNTIAVFTLIGAIAVVGWNIFSGYTGYISLGHSVFYGFGAYTLGLASLYWHIPGGWEPFLLLPLAGLVAGAVALPLGWIALRTRRHTFIVISIAWVFIFQLLAYNLRGFTRGSNGVFMPLTPWVAPYADLPFYYVAFAVLLAATLVSWWIRHAKFGLGLLAIREDEDRALGLGVKTYSFKLTAYVISAVFVGIAGAIFAYYVGSVFPEQGFNPAVDLTIALMAFLGGIGTVAGPLVGALLLTPLQQWLDLQFGGQGVNLVIYGALFLVIILLLPRGIVPSLQERWRTWRTARQTRLAQRTRAAANQEQPAVLAERGGEG